MKAISPVPSQLVVAATKKEEGTALAGGNKEARQACEDFEAVFIQQMLQVLRKTVMKSGLWEGGLQEDIYTSFYDGKIAEEIAHGRGIGIADVLYRNIASHHYEAPGSRGEKGIETE